MKVDRERLEELAGRPVFYKGRFRNLERTPAHGLREFLRWQRDPQRSFPRPQRFPVQEPETARLNEPAQAPRLTWLGHASFLFQYRGLNLLTDPVLSERASPLSFAGPKRTTPAALAVEELPVIHQVLISHNHYDHLDEPTVRALHRRFGDRIRWFVPLDLGDWFRRRRIRNVREMGWWQQCREQHHEVFCVPAQHFSGRGVRDRNRTLWCGWILDCGDFSLYFAGDTGYGGCFTEIGRIFRDLDLALLPIGAYEPRWFMAPVHVTPEEAVQIHVDVRARQSVAMHWGTFVLTDEPMDEPPKRLREALERRNLDAREFCVLEHGETMEVEAGRRD